MKTAALFLLFFPLQVFSQISLTGMVKDNITSHPVGYATIYVNNTSIGTLSDTTGNFTLEHVPVPCEIIISHISYETKTVTLKDNQNPVLAISLIPKKMELKGIRVTDKNLREKNLKRFKSNFLGEDYWGKNASIENDSVLIFDFDYSVVDTIQVPQDEKTNKDEMPFKFVVKATSPIKVKLPLLGYELNIALVHYSEFYNPIIKTYQLNYYGYHYFKPVPVDSKGKLRRNKEHRLQAYYNSSQHFCRSLYEQRLKENGYLVSEKASSYKSLIEQWQDFKIDSCLQFSGNEMKIVGLKNSIFLINYFEDKKGRPLNLKNIKEGYYTGSYLYILNDTCTIRDGLLVPDNSMVFGPFIGTKRIGALLPNNYIPGE